MPLISHSNFRPARWLAHAHAQTIWPALVRRPWPLPWTRERLELNDGDFIDLDWLRCGSPRLVVIAHGLEGGSRRHYTAGVAQLCRSVGWDTLAWNFRGCSGEPNRLPRAYHSGATEDLRAVLEAAEATGRYRELLLVGFSLGGNLILKYLGEAGHNPGRIRGAVAISVPCDLRASAERMDQPDRRFYRLRFIRSMRARMDQKRLQFGENIPSDHLKPCETFREFDDTFTAPLHGFESALDYWARCSALGFLEPIRVPTLILNARDDPFLTPSCFPTQRAETHPWVFLEAPEKGGHVGFVSEDSGSRRYWAEARIVEFFQEHVGPND